MPPRGSTCVVLARARDELLRHDASGVRSRQAGVRTPSLLECARSRRLDSGSAHARSGRAARLSRRRGPAPASVWQQLQRREADHSRLLARVGGALRSRLSSHRRPRRKHENSCRLLLSKPNNAVTARGRPERFLGRFWGVGPTPAVSAGPRISAVYGKLIPRNPHHGHPGSPRNDVLGVGEMARHKALVLLRLRVHGASIWSARSWPCVLRDAPWDRLDCRGFVPIG
jgi:hypothetical protein